MGIKINWAIGYGILLSPEQKERVSINEIYSKLGNFYKNKLELAKRGFTKIKREKKLASNEMDAIQDTFKAISFFESIDNGKLVLKDQMNFDEAVLEIIHQTFLCPQMKDVGSSSFFGILETTRYNDSFAWALLPLLNIKTSNEGAELKLPLNTFSSQVVQKFFPSSEFTMGEELLEGGSVGIPWYFIYEKCWEVKSEKNNRTYYIPNRWLLRTFEELTERLLDRKKEGELPVFEYKEECVHFTHDFLRKQGIKFYPQHEFSCYDEFSYYYDEALTVINLFYPEISLEPLRRYLVFWWS